MLTAANKSPHSSGDNDAGKLLMSEGGTERRGVCTSLPPSLQADLELEEAA